VLGVLLVYDPLFFAQEKALAPDLAQIKDGKIWSVINADCQTAMEDGKRVVRLKPKGKAHTPSDIGLALVEGLDFTEGTLEIDLKGKGKVERTFIGVGFKVVDGKTFEAVYFRPFNFMRKEEPFRSRAVQYVAWPDHTCEKLREGNPGIYESAIKPITNSSSRHARPQLPGPFTQPHRIRLSARKQLSRGEGLISGELGGGVSPFVPDRRDWTTGPAFLEGIATGSRSARAPRCCRGIGRSLR
jgi:hypothetical protein